MYVKGMYSGLFVLRFTDTFFYHIKCVPKLFLDFTNLLSCPYMVLQSKELPLHSFFSSFCLVLYVFFFNTTRTELI